MAFSPRKSHLHSAQKVYEYSESAVQSVPHLAFKVSDLEQAVRDHRLLLAPYEPITGFRVAMIEDNEMPIELIETKLTDEEIWSLVRSGRQSSIY